MGNPIGTKEQYINQSLDNLLSSGIYVCYDTQHTDFVNSVQYPANMQFWHVIVYNGGVFIKQVATPINGASEYFRIKDGDNAWTPWKQIATL